MYTYTDAAKAAGPPELLGNPTFTFMLEIDAFDLEEFVTFLVETLEKFLDGEENFTYYVPIFVGEKITDIIDKKEGALWFVISDNTVTNQNEETIAKTRTNYIFRH